MPISYNAIEINSLDSASNFDSQVALHNSIIRHKILTQTYTIEQICTNLANNDISDIFTGDIIQANTPAISETGWGGGK